MKPNKGFTLIELIIAISILSSLMFTGSYVYSMISSRWDKQMGEFDKHFSQTRSFALLQNLLSGVMPFVVEESNKNQSLATLFFVGKEDSLLAVSRNGIVNDHYPEIFRLTAIRNQNNKLDLVYQSVSTKDLLLLSAEQTINFTKKFVLLHDMDSVEFKYFGWANLNSKIEAFANGLATQHQWFDAYSGLDANLNPEIVTLDIIKHNKHVSLNALLDHDSEKLLQKSLMGTNE